MVFSQLLRSRLTTMKKKSNRKAPPKRAPTQVHSTTIAESNLKEMAEAFAMFDKKGHRMISSEQLGCAMRALGENPTESEILRIKNEVDIIDGGSIGFTEFVKAMNMLCGKMNLEDDIKLAFKIFDTDGDGSISVSELRHVMTNLGDKLSEEEADELLNAVDIDGDGVINFEEFTRMILS